MPTPRPMPMYTVNRIFYRLRTQDVPTSKWALVAGGREAMGTIVEVAHDNGMTVEFAINPL